MRRLVSVLFLCTLSAACGEPDALAVYTSLDAGNCNAVHQDAGPDETDGGSDGGVIVDAGGEFDGGVTAFCSSQIAWAELRVTNASPTEVLGQTGTDEVVGSVNVTAAKGERCVHRSELSQLAFVFNLSFPVTGWHLASGTGEVLAERPCSQDAHSDGLHVTFCSARVLVPGESVLAQVKGNTTAAKAGDTATSIVGVGYAIDKDDGSGFYMVGTPTPPVTRTYR